MKILVIGLSGFLGKNLFSFLRKKKNYTILSIQRSSLISKNTSKNFLFLKADIGKLTNKNFDFIKNFKPEVIINLAWEGIPNFSYNQCKKNFNLHMRFFNKIKEIESIKKIIMTGSCWEYSKELKQCIETSKKFSSSYFAKSKISIFNKINNFSKKKKINFIWFRIFFMYGPFQKEKSLIPSIISSIKKNKTLSLKYPNDSNDFIYVGDVCEAILKSIEHYNINGIYNLGSGRPTKNKIIYSKVLKVLKKIYIKKNNLRLENSKGKIKYAKIKKISKKLGWQPKTSLVSGIKILAKQK
jgi:nucleoside-diphosphate-sugar epimerase